MAEVPLSVNSDPAISATQAKLSPPQSLQFCFILVMWCPRGVV